jgi:hypothetical protein
MSKHWGSFLSHYKIPKTTGIFDDAKAKGLFIGPKGLGH